MKLYKVLLCLLLSAVTTFGEVFIRILPSDSFEQVRDKVNTNYVIFEQSVITNIIGLSGAALLSSNNTFSGINTFDAGTVFNGTLALDGITITNWSDIIPPANVSGYAGTTVITGSTNSVSFPLPLSATPAVVVSHSNANELVSVQIMSVDSNGFTYALESAGGYITDPIPIYWVASVGTVDSFGVLSVIGADVFAGSNNLFTGDNTFTGDTVFRNSLDLFDGTIYNPKFYDYAGWSISSSGAGSGSLPLYPEDTGTALSSIGLGYIDIYQSIAFTVGETYYLRFTVSDYVNAGAPRTAYCNLDGSTIMPITSNGNYSVSFVASSVQQTLKFGVNNPSGGNLSATISNLRLFGPVALGIGVPTIYSNTVTFTDNIDVREKTWFGTGVYLDSPGTAPSSAVTYATASGLVYAATNALPTTMLPAYVRTNHVGDVFITGGLSVYSGGVGVTEGALNMHTNRILVDLIGNLAGHNADSGTPVESTIIGHHAGNETALTNSLVIGRWAGRTATGNGQIYIDSYSNAIPEVGWSATNDVIYIDNGRVFLGRAGQFTNPLPHELRGDWTYKGSPLVTNAGVGSTAYYAMSNGVWTPFVPGSGTGGGSGGDVYTTSNNTFTSGSTNIFYGPVTITNLYALQTNTTFSLTSVISGGNITFTINNLWAGYTYVAQWSINPTGPWQDLAVFQAPSATTTFTVPDPGGNYLRVVQRTPASPLLYSTGSVVVASTSVVGRFIGDGAGLTNISGFAGVVYTASNNTFTGTNTFSGPVLVTNAAFTFTNSATVAIHAPMSTNLYEFVIFDPVLNGSAQMDFAFTASRSKNANSLGNLIWNNTANSYVYTAAVISAYNKAGSTTQRTNGELVFATADAGVLYTNVLISRPGITINGDVYATNAVYTDYSGPASSTLAVNWARLTNHTYGTFVKTESGVATNLIVTNTTVSGTFLPGNTNTDVGSLASPFRSGYFTTNSLYLGGHRLTVSAGASTNLVLDGRAVGVEPLLKYYDVDEEDYSAYPLTLRPNGYWYPSRTLSTNGEYWIINQQQELRDFPLPGYTPYTGSIIVLDAGSGTSFELWFYSGAVTNEPYTFGVDLTGSDPDTGGPVTISVSSGIVSPPVDALLAGSDAITGAAIYLRTDAFDGLFKE